MRTPFNNTPRAISRLVVFVAASVSVHAVIGGIFGIPGVSTRSQDATNRAVLRATLHQERSSLGTAESSTPTERLAFFAHSVEPTSTDTGAAQTVSATAAHALDMRHISHGGMGALIPDYTWYEAFEVDVRAEPLAPVELAYPVDLKEAGIFGHVRLRLFIDEQGVVIKAEITSSKPERMFDRSAIEGWQSVKFTPASKNGVAVKSQKLLQLDFHP